MKVCGGFTEHDAHYGYRGSCACGWSGPWRGWSLMTVERDVLEHWGDCPEHSFAASDSRGTVDATYEEGPGGAGNANRDHDDTPVEEGAAMTDTTAATAIREGEVR